MFKNILITALLFFAGNFLHAQIILVGNEPLEKSSQDRITKKLSDSTEQGYRVQLLFTGKRQEALDAKAKLEAQYPSCPIYLIYDKPNFKIRIGDYLTKVEALSAFYFFKGEFPGSFVIEDKVNPGVRQYCN